VFLTPFGAALDRVLPAARPRAWFRGWRRTRPSWGGLLVIAGGAELLALPLAPLPVFLREGTAAVSGVAIGLILIVAGLFFWFAPEQRAFIAIITAICSVASVPSSNFGGFGIGAALGVIGSSMAFGWRPYPQRPAAGPIGAGAPSGPAAAGSGAGGADALPG
jgi:hypothetical protein